MKLVVAVVAGIHLSTFSTENMQDRIPQCQGLTMNINELGLLLHHCNYCSDPSDKEKKANWLSTI